jgi:hypothetical protein
MRSTAERVFGVVARRGRHRQPALSAREPQARAALPPSHTLDTASDQFAEYVRGPNSVEGRDVVGWEFSNGDRILLADPYSYGSTGPRYPLTDRAILFPQDYEGYLRGFQLGIRRDLSDLRDLYKGHVDLTLSERDRGSEYRLWSNSGGVDLSVGRRVMGSRPLSDQEAQEMLQNRARTIQPQPGVGRFSIPVALHNGQARLYVEKQPETGLDRAFLIGNGRAMEVPARVLPGEPLVVEFYPDPGGRPRTAVIEGFEQIPDSVKAQAIQAAQQELTRIQPMGYQEIPTLMENRKRAAADQDVWGPYPADY